MIIGFKLKKVLVEKLKNTNEKLKITKVNTKTDITNIEEQKIEIKDKDALVFEFSFEIQYEPDIAKILIDGQVIYLVENNRAAKILESWKKKEIQKELRIEILNFVLNKCGIKALALEEDLNLPAHFPLPRFQLKESQETKGNSKNNKEKNNKTDYAG
jgi:hypothetical protein